MRKNSKILAFILVLVQIIGYMLVFVLRWRHMAPCAESMHLSPWWDFTPTAIWALMVALPALYAYTHKVRLRWLPIGVAVLPISIVLLLTIAGTCLLAYRSYELKQERKRIFDTPQKIEQVAGVRLPEFQVTDYEEHTFPDDMLKRTVCRANGTFAETPSESFYQTLDSLCVTDSMHWRKGGGAYAYDSIYGRKNISKLVLSLVMTKGKRDFEIRYDDCVKFKINKRHKNIKKKVKNYGKTKRNDRWRR